MTSRHDGRASDRPVVVADSASMFDLVSEDALVELLCTGFEFTEGPCWNPRTEELLFSDIPASTRHRWGASGLELVLADTSKANGMTYDRSGALVVCEHLTNAVVRFDDGCSHRSVLCESYRGVPLNSPNDVVVRTADNTIYFTDPMIGRSGDWIGRERPGALGWQGVFRVPAEGGEPELLVGREEFINPNGLCFSPDESLLYVNDSRRRAIKSFPVGDDGRLGVATELGVGIGADMGSISCVDGMECDEHGNIWVTSPGGVWVFDPSLRRLGVLHTQEDCASLVWGGPDLRDLYLTTRTSLRRVRTLVASATLPHHVRPSDA